MADIFISCVEADSSFVWQLASQLESRGWTVWWDKNFRADADIAAETERERESARWVLVLWTRISVNSPFVLHDANTAYDANKLVQVKASNVQVSDIPRTLQSLPLLDAVDLSAIARALTDREDGAADLLAETVHSKKGQPGRIGDEGSVSGVEVSLTPPKTKAYPDVGESAPSQKSMGVRIALLVVTSALVVAVASVALAWTGLLDGLATKFAAILQSY
jgi:hypothetical protein